MSRKPNVFIIGAAKAGTTALYDYLKLHPEIFLTKEKEPHFFDNDLSYGKGEDWYLEKYFTGASEYMLRGEATPGYMRNYHKVIPRLKKFCNGNSPKILVVLRDPVKRAWSHYLHMRRINEEKESFENALLLETDRLKLNQEAWSGYFGDGLYSEQIKAWFEVFPRENFYFLLSDKLYSNHVSALQDICRFLGAESKSFSPDRLISNQASQPRFEFLMRLMTDDNIVKRIASKVIKSDQIKRGVITRIRRTNLKPGDSPKMAAETAVMLRKKYEKDICELEKLINMDLSAWKL